jgi:hypothetical protein
MALGSFLEDTRDLMLGPPPDVVPPPARSEFVTIQDGAYEKARASYSQAMPIYAVAGIAMSVLGSPLILAAAAGGMIWTVARGWKATGESKVKLAKGELLRHLNDVLRQVQTYFFTVELAEGRFSRVDEHFEALERQLMQFVDGIAAQRAADVRSELARLEALAQLRAEARQESLQAVVRALDEWERLGEMLGQLLGDESSQHHLSSLLTQSPPAQSST